MLKKIKIETKNKFNKINLKIFKYVNKTKIIF